MGISRHSSDLEHRDGRVLCHSAEERREGEGKEDDRELLYRSCSHFRNSCRLPVPCPRDCSSGNLKFFQKLTKEHLTIS